MRNNKRIAGFKIVAVNIVLMACASITNVIPTDTPAVTSTKTPRPTPTITPTPFYEVEAGKTITVQSGGFSFSQVAGYEVFETDNSGVYLTSEDQKLDVLLFASARPSGISIPGLMNGWLENLDSSYGNFVHADTVEDTTEGIPLLFVDFTGMDGTVPVEGRITIYEPQDSKLLHLLVISYGDQRWEREGRQVLELTMNSIEFFNIAAWQDCPIAKNPDYGLTPARPIKIGGGASDGPDRISNYLEALLGAHNEIVSYQEDVALDQDGVELNVYVLRIGNIYRVIYFDTTSFEELRVPLGLTCSVPLPQKP